MDDIERQARAVFGNSGNPLRYDDLENLPSDQVEYWLSKRSPHLQQLLQFLPSVIPVLRQCKSKSGKLRQYRQ